MRLASHCCRHENEVANKAIVLWSPTNGKMKKKKENNLIDNLIEDSGLNDINKIKTMMMVREKWKMCISTVERPTKN